jgi:hypothetical protein
LKDKKNKKNKSNKSKTKPFELYELAGESVTRIWSQEIIFNDMIYFIFSKFRLSYYPHRLEAFGNLLSSVFGPKASHSVFADFKSMEEQPNPAFYIHTIEKN